MRGSGDRANVPIKQADWALFHCGKNNLSHNRLQSDSTRCNSLIILIKTPQLHKRPCCYSLLLVWHLYDELWIFPEVVCLASAYASVCTCIRSTTGFKVFQLFYKFVTFAFICNETEGFYLCWYQMTPLRGWTFDAAVSLSRYIHVNSPQISAPQGKLLLIVSEAESLTKQLSSFWINTSLYELTATVQD